jgi:hypothetical protein
MWFIYKNDIITDLVFWDNKILEARQVFCNITIRVEDRGHPNILKFKKKKLYEFVSMTS